MLDSKKKASQASNEFNLIIAGKAEKGLNESRDMIVKTGGIFCAQEARTPELAGLCTINGKRVEVVISSWLVVSSEVVIESRLRWRNLPMKARGSAWCLRRIG